MQTSSTTEKVKHSRAYKACLACRQRKAKCDLGRTGQPPCYKCHREQRECVFEEQRRWGAKRRKIADHGGRELDDTNATNDEASEPPVPPSPIATYQAATTVELSHHQDETETSMIRAVVSNGTEALDLLLQAASHSRPGSNNQASTSTSQQSNLPHTRQSLLPHAIHSPNGSAALTTWQSSKFVRTGWCTAESAILYMDL